MHVRKGDLRTLSFLALDHIPYAMLPDFYSLDFLQLLEGPVSFFLTTLFFLHHSRWKALSVSLLRPPLPHQLQQARPREEVPGPAHSRSSGRGRQRSGRPRRRRSSRFCRRGSLDHAALAADARGGGRPVRRRRDHDQQRRRRRLQVTGRDQLSDQQSSCVTSNLARPARGRQPAGPPLPIKKQQTSV